MKIINRTVAKDVIIMDKETGEIIEEKTINMEKQTIVKDSEEFMIWYENSIEVISNMKASEFKLIFYVMFYFSRDLEFYLNNSVYKEIENKTGLKKRTVLEAIPSLMEKDIVRRINRGFYMVNPNYFYKGSSKKRINMYSKYLKIKNDD